ncbi:MAG: hypothetical protein FWG69_00365 [Oscillospiraceae bacterium]|nr:hypothetical protein [Oscillospiraceae bacterium]
MVGIIIACAGLFIIVISFYARSENPVRSAFAGMGSGFAVLIAAWLSLPFFDIFLQLNAVHIFMSLTLGPPGVVLATVFQLIYN